MDRRAFLGLLGAGVAVAAFDPHRVIFDMGRKLWTPEPLVGFGIPYHQNDATTGTWLNLELEKVRNEIPLMFRRVDLFLKLIQMRGNAEKVNRTLMRHFAEPPFPCELA